MYCSYVMYAYYFVDIQQSKHVSTVDWSNISTVDWKLISILFMFVHLLQCLLSSISTVGKYLFMYCNVCLLFRHQTCPLWIKCWVSILLFLCSCISMLIVIGSRNRGARGPWLLLIFKTLHRNSNFAIENP